MRSKSIGLKILAVIVILSTFTAACSNVTPTSAPTVALPTTAPTIDVAPTLSQAKTQAVQTFAANLTQNAPTAEPVQPTATSLPTATLPPPPTAVPITPPTAVPTATSVARVSTLQPTPTLSTYNCVVFYVSPAPGDLVKVDTNFTGMWRVENTGTETWTKDEFVIKYVYGTKFQTDGDVINLDRSVGPLGTYSVNISMKSPDLAGPYYSRWEFQKGNLTVCVLNMTLHVVN
jgi:hypothetical protein